ncbi:CLUMA_CG011555, isoform C [Clunio marinus]|uniref:CLUMA_CG011555, isoform C n=1 Tax=Clunio marinus TaxID=568069 RepID=A0A1J1IIB2_9DIPT|nr:CLUMA_CG011555, isoform C [Clunio marinus]
MHGVALIIIGIGAAIYFIVDDAIDKKIEGCMYRHFYATKLLEEFNVTLDRDPSKINYSAEECQTIIDQGRRKTSFKIDKMDFPDCFKQQLKGTYLDSMMLKAVLEKYGRDYKIVLQTVMAKVRAVCTAPKSPSA